MRAFVAINLPDRVRDALARVQIMVPVGRAVARENLHLTLAFLDDQPDEKLEELHYALETMRHPPLDLMFQGLGCFGGDKPRLLFADVAAAPDLSELARTVVTAARRVGMTLPKGRFHPHVTLTRLGQGGEGADRLSEFLRAQGDIDLPGFTARSFGLFRSDLHPGGVRYTELAQYPLI
ncbi:RNA 2',3'-cyclic phosphodiesterase [Arenibacterium sp. CAU 1754]